MLAGTSLLCLLVLLSLQYIIQLRNIKAIPLTSQLCLFPHVMLAYNIRTISQASLLCLLSHGQSTTSTACSLHQHHASAALPVGPQHVMQAGNTRIVSQTSLLCLLSHGQSTTCNASQ